MARPKEADINQQTFEQNLLLWQQELAGCFVAIIDGQLVDLDTDKAALTQRTQNFSPNGNVLIKPIPVIKLGED